MARWQTKAVAVAAVLVLGLTACSDSGGKQAEENTDSGTGGNAANTPRMKVALITHQAPGDTFWDLVRKGAEDAAAKDNVELQYSADPEGAGQANLVQTAIDSKVDGIAVTLAKPDALLANTKKAADAGIPVVALNGGINEWQQSGALGYFGQDEKIAGQAAGDKLNELGAKKVVCVIQEQGHVGLEARCAGVKQNFKGQTENLYITGTDMPGSTTTMTSKLQTDKSIDYVVTLGAPFAIAAVKAAKDAGSTAKIGTFDTNKDLIGAIKSGDVQWAVDQQPYLQGYLAVDSLWLYKTNGNTIGGGEATLTGPAFIDKSNVAEVEKFALAGKR